MYRIIKNLRTCISSHRRLEPDQPQPFLEFSFNADKGHVASCLKPAVEKLIRTVMPSWLAVILYDPPSAQETEAYCHQNFSVNPNLRGIFEEIKDKMFLLTGIPCRVNGYTPNWNQAQFDSLPQLPPFALILKPDTVSYPDKFYRDWVRFEFNEERQLKIYYPEGKRLVKQYVEDVIRKFPEREVFEERIRLTLNAYIHQYPQPPLNEEIWPEQYVTVFIPYDYILGGFYEGGLLISFDRLIDRRVYSFIKGWCKKVGEVIAKEIYKKLVPWPSDLPSGQGEGKEMAKYIGCFSFEPTSFKPGEQECKKIIGKVKDEADHDLKVLLEKTNDLHQINDIKSIICDQSPIPESVQEKAEKLRRTFPYVVQQYETLLSSRKGGVCPLFFLGKRLEYIYLIDLLVWSKEAGWQVDMDLKMDGRALLSQDYAWKLTYSVLPQPLIFRSLIQKRLDFTETRQVLLKVEEDKKSYLRWILDAKLKDRKPRELEERGNPNLRLAYLFDALDKGKEEVTLTDRQFTMSMLAAEILAERHIFIIPVWKKSSLLKDNIDAGFLNHKPAEDWIERLSNPTKAGECWVILGDGEARILIKRQWEIRG